MRKNMQIEEPPKRFAEPFDWHFPPLTITATQPIRDGLHLHLRIAYVEEAFTFVGQYRPQWQERTFQAAVQQALARGTRQEPFPLILLPYLSDAHLDALVEQGVSGLDLCGNGVILVPERWLIRQGGRPNRFRIELPLRNPYAGKASLVGRTLLRRPEFARLDDLRADIVQRGGDISLALISRTVQRLDEEAITLPAVNRRVRLVQADKLCDALARAYDPRRIRPVWRGKVPDVADALPQLFASAAERGVRMVVTGVGSASRYAPIAIEAVLRLYIDHDGSVAHWLDAFGAERTERFANLEVFTYPDATCFFEGEVDEAGVRWASPVQTYLEMAGSDDVRLRSMAAGLRTEILGAVHGTR